MKFYEYFFFFKCHSVKKCIFVFMTDSAWQTPFYQNNLTILRELFCPGRLKYLFFMNLSFLFLHCRCKFPSLGKQTKRQKGKIGKKEKTGWQNMKSFLLHVVIELLQIISLFSKGWIQIQVVAIRSQLQCTLL